MKKKLGIAFILAALLTANVFGHAGEVHTILGTVKTLHQDHIVVTDKNGKQITAVFAKTTKYWKGKTKATRADVKVGSRVSVELSKDGKTATSIKIGAATPSTK